jgi:WD40 repeat protein/transcriptional regulator with XRE-family HTH domain
MKRSSYDEADYAFGQAMLSLRTALGLTQADLAQRLRVSRKAVGKWEAGGSYPKASHLKAVLAFALRQRAFAAGREEEQIRAFWQAAHQKVLLDEAWLAAVLTQPSAPPASVPVEEAGGAAVGSAPPAAPASLAQAAQPGDSPLSVGPAGRRDPSARGPRVEWGDALDVPTFYGREQELALLVQWVVEERCRVVSMLGMGGIGKSALVVRAMQRLAAHFEVVLFRSLRDAPSCEALLETCLQVLAPEPLVPAPQGLEPRLSLLLEELRSSRILLVLDNLEVLLSEGDVLGRLRPSYEGYGRLLRQVAQIGHQSCLLLTSREKPAELRALEGPKTPVRALRLPGLEASACEQLLAEHELLGSQEERARLVKRYEGNPLALNMVAETITDLFGGAIGPFLAQETLVFGSISDLLDEQWGRLSPLEQTVLSWLAILREPVTLEELRAVLVFPLAHVQVLEAVDGLRRRSLIERGQRVGSFTLQSVVLEYVTSRLVTTASQEIGQGRLLRLREHGLSQAGAKDYVRQTQERLLLAPALALLQSVGHARAEVEGQLRALLDGLRERSQQDQGYGPANLVALLGLLRGELRGLDLSRLVLRGVYLQGVEMQDATLAGALIRESVFTQTFDVITAVAISPDGQSWAAAGRRGEVRVWESGREGEQEAAPTLHRVWQAHTDTIYDLAFSPDGRLLASGSWDDTLKLWDLESSALLWSSWHPHGVQSLAMAPDGRLLATDGKDASVRLWDLKLGTQVQTLPHPSPVFSVAWSPDGGRLATGSVDGPIRLWEIGHSRPATCVQTLTGHSNRVLGLAFAPDASLLASASGDGSVKLWDVESGGVRQTLLGHTGRVIRVVWSPDGRTLASGGLDQTIWLWDVEQNSYRTALQGHSASVERLAFTPDSRRLLSGGDDSTLRLWDVGSGQCIHIMQGYTASLFDVDWSPDGTQLASVSSDTGVSIWELERSTAPRVLQGHRGIVYALAWSPDGRFLASSCWDNVIYLWDASTGESRQTLRNPDHVDTLFFGVAWSPDGKLLACGTSRQGVHVWEMTTRSPRWVSRQLPTWIRRVAWSPDGTRLVGGGDDGHVYMWDGSDGTLLLGLAGHHGVVTSVSWSPDGRRLASGSGSSDSGEVFVWEVQSGECVHVLVGHPGMVSAVTWAPRGERLISGDSDGRLRWWDVHSGQCLRVREAHQGTIQALKVSPDGSKLASCGDDGAITIWGLHSGEHLRTLRRDRPYERLNITGIRGLTQAQKATLRALGAVEDETVNSS